MQRCPNCSYKLVLLSNRPKYKCALCSKLYPRKEIESKDFQEFNKRKKIEDIETYEKERKEQLSKIREIKSHLKRLFNGFPKLSKLDYEKNKAQILTRNEEWRLRNIEYDDNRKKEYYKENKEKILQKHKLKRQENPQEYSQKRKDWRTKNIETNRMHYIIRTYRRKQKALALQRLENSQQEASNINIFHSVPTYPHSYLLTH
ncbi:MAG: hypothetical protein KKG75_00535 [Nanoarchaeota archaeon]|nr:hypothetical protein [Nanoarchaeota archaeon]